MKRMALITRLAGASALSLRSLYLSTGGATSRVVSANLTIYSITSTTRSQYEESFTRSPHRTT